MCLTAEAYAERRWGSYQILRTLLEEQKLSDRYQVWSTASETYSDYLQNLLSIYQLLDSYAEERESDVFRELHSDQLKPLMVEDLYQLEQRLEDVSGRFADLAKAVRQMRR